MSNGNDEPVLLVTDQDGYIVHAGQPQGFKNKLLGEYVTDGYTIKTITISEYRELVKTAKWIYDE